jgi:TP901 family phage tail tape measure protein
MTQQIAYLEAVVGADITTFRRGMQDVRRELGLFSDTAAGLQHLGRNLTFAVTVPITAGLGSAVKIATDFDAAMRNVASISDEVAGNFTEMSGRVRDFGAGLREGPLAAAEALNTVFQAGVTNADLAFAIAQSAAKTAEAGLADMQTTTEALVAAMLSYSAGADEATHYSDVLTRMVQVGVGTMSEFANSLAQVLPTASALGVSFDEVGANLAFLTQRGFPASRAATSLNNAFAKLLSPTEALQEVFDEIGVGSGRELIATLGGVQEALNAIFQATGGDETLLKEFFSDERGFRAMASLFTNMEVWNDTLREFGLAVDGATDRAHQQQMMSLQAQLDLLVASIQAFGIAVGTNVLPFIAPMVDGLRNLFIEASNLPPEVLLMATAFTALVAAAGPITWLIGSMLTPIGSLTIGVGLLATAFATDFMGIRTAVSSVVDSALPRLNELKDAVLEFFGIIANPQDQITNYGSEYDPLSSINVRGGISVNSISFEVLEGEGPWTTSRRIADAIGASIDINELQTMIDNVVNEAVGGYHAGTYTLPLSGATYNVDFGPVDASNFVIPERGPFDRAMDFINQYEMPGTTTTIGDRIALAITEAGPKIVTALDNIRLDISTWFSETFLPSFDTWGSDILNQISAGLTLNAETSETNGNPVLELVRSLFNFDAEEITTEVNANLPKLTEAFNTLISSFGDWLKTEGARSAGEIIGYSVGSVGIAIGEALRSVLSLQFGGQSDLQVAGENLAGGVQAGFNQAIKDSGYELSMWDTLVTAVTSSLVLAFAASRLVPLLLGVGTGVSQAVTTVLAGTPITITTTSWVVNLAAGALSALTGIITSVIGAAFTGVVIPLAAALLTISLIGAFVLGAIDPGALDDLASQISDALGLQMSQEDITVDISGTNVEITYGNALETVGPDGFPIESGTDRLEAGLSSQRENARIENLNQAAIDAANYIGQALTDDMANVPIPVEVNLDNIDPLFLLPEAGVDTSGASENLLGSEYESGVSTGQKLLAGYKAGILAGVSSGSTEGEEASGGTLSAALSAMLGAQLMAVDLTEYVPVEHMTTVGTMMTTPVTSEFIRVFGSGGALMQALILFNSAVIKVTPVIVSSFKSLATQISDALQPAISAIQQLGSLVGSIGGMFGLTVDTGRTFASGGRPTVGGLNWLGGRGVEPFIPGENGTIVPTRMVRDALKDRGEGGGNTFVINAYGESPYELARMVQTAIQDSSYNYR